MFHMFHKRKGVTLLNAPNKFFPCLWRLALVKSGNTFTSDLNFFAFVLTTCSVLTSVTALSVSVFVASDFDCSWNGIRQKFSKIAKTGH